MTNGNVVFDLTGLGEYSDDFMGIFGEEGVAIPSIFGSTEVTGNLTEFAVSLDEESSSAEDLIAFINAGMSSLGFSNAASESGLVWTFEAASTTTPEPATLLILERI